VSLLRCAFDCVSAGAALLVVGVLISVVIVLGSALGAVVWLFCLPMLLWRMREGR